MTTLNTGCGRLVARTRIVVEASTRRRTPLQRERIQNTVTVQRELTGDIGWGLTSGVRPACLGRRVVATAIGRADD
jgi:hypothetical protein